ncbi:MAG: ABC transporter ATP-binding protein [Thermonemataceae bacterium]|nr:ABC transporter ATP-binding protein [Thermonemataceae bacterium]
MGKKEKNKQSERILDLQIIRRLYAFSKPYRLTFYSVVFLTFALALLGPIRPYLVQYSIDNYLVEGREYLLLQMTLLMVFLLFIQAIIQYTHSYWSGWLGQTIVKDIRIQLYEKMLSLRLKFYDKTPVGRLVTRNISDIETLSTVFGDGIAAIVADILQILAILLIMFFTNWKLTLISLSMLPFLLLTTYIFKEKIKVAFAEVRNAVANLNTFVQEHISGINIVQVFGAETQEAQKFNLINKEHRKANLKSVLYYSVYFPVAEIISAAGTGLLVWYGAKEVIEEETTLGVLIAFMMYISLFFRPIRMIADRFNTLQMAIVASERVLNLLDNQEDTQKNGTLQTHLEGKIEFRNVYFAYNEDNYVLKNVSFTAKKGETLAFVGATGAGKSSIINLINRFYEISAGEILLDGKNLQEYDLEHLRSQIGVVLQDVFLFSGSIRENITLGNRQISDEKIWQAAELVGAKGFIEKLKGNLDYEVMERGATLSVGQRQLISFVRAMVYDPKIIILDEATSSVDTETEEMIQKAIEKLMKGRTAIVIAHRLSTIQNAQQIIVLDKGEIKEIGNHEDLLKRNGYYTQLYQMQYKELV